MMMMTKKEGGEGFGLFMLPEELLHEAVKALNPPVLGRLDRLGSVRDERQHRGILSPRKHAQRREEDGHRYEREPAGV